MAKRDPIYGIMAEFDSAQDDAMLLMGFGGAF